MRLSSTFSLLLVTLLGLVAEFEAAPTRRSLPPMLTFPVRSLPNSNPQGVAPHMYLQRLMNRGEQRLAEMTGRPTPSEEELYLRLVKRMYSVPTDDKIDAGHIPGGKMQKRHSAGKRHHHHQDQSNGGGLQFIPPPEGGVNGNIPGPDFVPFPASDLPGPLASPSNDNPSGKVQKRRNARKHHHHQVQSNGGGLQFIPPPEGGVNGNIPGPDFVPFPESDLPGSMASPSNDNPSGFVAESLVVVGVGRGGSQFSPGLFDDNAGSIDPFGSDGLHGPFDGISGFGDPSDESDSFGNPFDESDSSDDPFDESDSFGNPFDGSDSSGDPFDAEGGIQIVPGPDGTIIIEPLSFNGTVTGSTGVSQAVIQAALNGGLTLANHPSGNNSLGLDIEGPDTGYIAEIQLGTPPRTFRVIVDSGSSDLWVGSEDCQAEGGGDCGAHQFLGPQNTSSFVQTKTAFQINYGTGHVEGIVVKDDVVLNGLKLQQHTFGVANLLSKNFVNDTSADGLMGLAPSSNSQQKTLTVVEALAKAGLIQAPIVSYKLSRLADNKNDGEITFGGLDPTKFDVSTLVQLPNVSKQGFWEATMDGATVDGQDVGLGGRTAILDTGTTVIVAPPKDAEAIHKLIKGAKPDGHGGFIVPCTISQSISLGFGKRLFSIDPRDIAFLPVDVTKPTGDCSSAITAGQTEGATEWLIGDTFLKNAYFSTDIASNTVSLARLL